LTTRGVEIEEDANEESQQGTRVCRLTKSNTTTNPNNTTNRINSNKLTLNGAGTSITLPELEQLHPALLLRLDDLLLRSVCQVEQLPDPVGHFQAGEVEAQGLVLPADLLLEEGAGLLIVLSRLAASILQAKGVDDGGVAGDVPAGRLLLDAQLGEAGPALLLGVAAAAALGDGGAGGTESCRRAEAAAVEIEEKATADGLRRLRRLAGGEEDATQHSECRARMDGYRRS
jgi:hypothetical protein